MDEHSGEARGGGKWATAQTNVCGETWAGPCWRPTWAVCAAVLEPQQRAGEPQEPLKGLRAQTPCLWFPWLVRGWTTLALAAWPAPDSPPSDAWDSGQWGEPDADCGFLLFQVLLPEHTPAGSVILTVSATDPDSGSNGDITFHLAVPSPDVAIDPSNGAWAWCSHGSI